MKSFLQLFIVAAFLAVGSLAFSPTSSSSLLSAATAKTSTSLSMGLFDGIMNAFGNEEYTAPPEGTKATARHILCKKKEDAVLVMEKVQAGGSFAGLAIEYSSCPSKSQGGSLGSFRPGMMVPEFDAVIFNADTKLNEVVGPVATKFGYHLIVVEKRSGIE